MAIKSKKTKKHTLKPHEHFNPNVNGKHISEIFDAYILKALKAVAKLLCRELGVKYKSFNTMFCDDELHKEAKGYNQDDHIRIRLRTPTTKAFHNLNDLIDTTVHEIMHTVYDGPHDKKFWRIHSHYMAIIKKELSQLPSEYV